MYVHTSGQCFRKSQYTFRISNELFDSISEFPIANILYTPKHRQINSALNLNLIFPIQQPRPDTIDPEYQQDSAAKSKSRQRTRNMPKSSKIRPSSRSAPPFPVPSRTFPHPIHNHSTTLNISPQWTAVFLRFSLPSLLTCQTFNPISLPPSVPSLWTKEERKLPGKVTTWNQTTSSSKYEKQVW